MAKEERGEKKGREREREEGKKRSLITLDLDQLGFRIDRNIHTQSFNTSNLIQRLCKPQR